MSPGNDLTDTDIPDTPEERFRLLVEGVTDYAMILLDPRGRVTSWNPGAEHIFGYGEAEVLGQPASLIFTPEDEAAGVPERELAAAAAHGRSPDVRWHLRRDGSRFWADGVMMALRDPSGDLRGFGKVLRDATDREQAEGALRASEERYRVAFEHAAVGVSLADLGGRFLQVNPAFCAITGYTEGELLASDFRSLTHPEDVAENTALMGRMLTGEVPSFVMEKRYVRKDGRTVWVQNSVSVVRGAQGEPLHTVALTEDVTERKTAEAERDRAAAALRESEARFRTMADAIPQVAWTADPDGGVNYYNQRWYDYSGLTFEQTRDWGWAEAIHPDDVDHAAGVWRAAVGAGTVSEVEYRLRRADGEYRWHLGRSAPVLDEMGQITQWVGTATDIQSHREVEEERERLLTQAEARAEREAVVNRIGQAVLAAPDPEGVQATAVSALGEHLGADRCYFTLFDRAGEWATVGDDWHRGGVPPLKGRFRLAEYRGIMEEYGRARTTLVIPDLAAETRFGPSLASLAALRMRSSVRVPLFDGDTLVAVLGVAMADAPRQWTDGEVALVEMVAAQTRAATDAAGLRWRERNIAVQLQDALRPAAPGAVPGLALKEHYHAALNESEIGGDFYDVFAIEKGCHALVVGDVSGKGLAAATQVAAVRNMLRYSLLSNTQTLAEAVTALNRTLAENGLLTGFATLFVGAYDSGARTLSYVNCGQEPGLLWRAATGAVEQLAPTGPILGAIAGAQFTEGRVSLAPKDCLALFTDGLTDAGPSHREMLGVEGVEALLSSCAPNAGGSAQEVVECVAGRLIAGMEAHAQGVVGDDVCLLVAAVDGFAVPPACDTAARV